MTASRRRGDGYEKVGGPETGVGAARARHLVGDGRGAATLGTAVGVRQAISPDGAGWRHLGFEVRSLASGQEHAGVDEENETCIVVLGGSGELGVDGERRQFEGRSDVFAGLPHALYVPPGKEFMVSAGTEVELGIGRAPARGELAPRFIAPSDVSVEVRGGHNVERQISHIIDPGQAEHLLCVEVYTPSGNWSSYPPHRHDEHVPGVEVDLDEIYHYRIRPPDGWAMQRLYDDQRTLDDVVLVKDTDTVLVRRGYHPVVMAPGYEGYYLNFLAGEHATWDARDEPDLAWVRGQWAGREQRLRIPFGVGVGDGDGER